MTQLLRTTMARVTSCSYSKLKKTCRGMTRAQSSNLNISYCRGLASSLFLLDNFKQRLTMAQILLAVAWIQDTAFTQSIRETGGDLRARHPARTRLGALRGPRQLPRQPMLPAITL